jgi:hypothetical protein
VGDTIVAERVQMDFLVSFLSNNVCERHINGEDASIIAEGVVMLHEYSSPPLQKPVTCLIVK